MPRDIPRTAPARHIRGDGFSPDPAAGGGDASESAAARVRFPPWVYPPRRDDVQFVRRRATVALAAGSAPTAPNDLVTDIPERSRLVVNRFEFVINDVTTATDMVMQFRRSGVVIPGFDNISIAARLAPSIGIEESAVALEVEPGRFDVNIINNDGAAHQVSVIYSGWLYQF